MLIDSIADTIDRALSSAGLDPHSGMLRNVSDTIRRSLAGGGLSAPDVKPSPKPGQDTPGHFNTHLYKGETGSRRYKLYVPNKAVQGAMPLVVMLHGCKQNPDDFAVGTRMNDLAEQHGFLVAYPAQSRNANGSNCWNWFQPGDQQRDSGEPSIIAGIVQEIAALHLPVDPKRVFVAGLSAGAAMAVILGATYPEIFRAVGAHSGLAHGAAHDVASAFGAMHGGRAGHAAEHDAGGTPTIVFQGDQDRTVVAANADAIVRQALGGLSMDEAQTSTRSGRASERAHAYTVTVYLDQQGRPKAEKWVIKGGSHAWFGGDPRGSYTDTLGPDASAEMVRFFLGR